LVIIIYTNGKKETRSDIKICTKNRLLFISDFIYKGCTFFKNVILKQ